jgi:hypothetical protein
MPNPSLFVLNVMAIVWAGIALAAAQAPVWSPLVPLAISLAVLGLTRNLQPGAASRGVRYRRIIVLCTFGEAIGICLGLTAADAAGRFDLWPCVLAAAVGAHFLPMARLLPAPHYYVTASVLLLAALAGLLLPWPARNEVIGLLGALSLWGTSLLLLRRPASEAAAG